MSRQRSMEVIEQAEYVTIGELVRLTAVRYSTLKFYTEEGTREIAEIPSDGKWMVTDVDLADISHFGGWNTVIEKHFSDGGIFDTIYERNR